MDSTKFGNVECFEEDAKTLGSEHAFAFFSLHRCMLSLRCIFWGVSGVRALL